MMTIKFKHPPGTTDPWNNFDPANPKHYSDKPGIYIYGLKIDIDGFKKFVPIYVGIAPKRTLQDRIQKDHYFPLKHLTKSKEIWSFNSIKNLKELQNVFSEMFYYNSTTKLSGAYRKSPKYLNQLISLKNLVFYQSQNYFNFKCGTNKFNAQNDNIKPKDVKTKFPTLGKQINKAFSFHATNFYYIYATYEEIEKDLLQIFDRNIIKGNLPKYWLERIEYTVKLALNIIGIHTTARANGEILDINIDLSNVQNELVNMGGHPYNNNGRYVKNFKIEIRK